MICLFRQEVDKLDLIETNGDYVLDHICTKAEITEELNGEYSFDGIFSIKPTLKKEMYDLLCEGSLLKVDDEYGKEYFRIAKVTKTSKRITVFARHITISDILTMFCEDVRPENLNGSGAMNWIFSNAKGTNWFTVGSNISNTNTAYYMNKNVYEALFTADNSFLERWGGEVYRRGFEIRINSKIGADRGVAIRSKKNLKGFEVNTSINSLVTRIYPKGFNGISINEKFVDSPYINSYARVYSKEIKFEDIRVNDENYNEGYATLEEAQAELKARAELMFETEKIDIIPANYRVDFVELGKTEEYKNYSILEKTWLGDTVEVEEINLNIKIAVRVLKRQYDLLKKIRTNTELSNKDLKEKPPTIKDILDEIKKLPTTENIIQIARDEATALLNAGINGYVVVNKNEILIMDTPDKNTATKVWRFNVNGLGFSPTGYYGTYETALTMDGKMVLNELTCEGINAILIKGGTLMGLRGNIRMNLSEDYFEVVHSESSTKTRIDAEGFYILDQYGETIASLASKESWSELKANKVFANNIENIYLGDSNLYVDHFIATENLGTIENPFSSFSQLNQYLQATPIINKNININIVGKTNEITEVLTLSNLKGSGIITITYDKNCVQRNSSFSIVLNGISNFVFINGGRTGYNTNDGAILLDEGNGHGVSISDCNNVMVEYININCKNWGIRSTRSNVRARRVDFGNSWCCYEANGGLVNLEDCVGNAGTAGGGDAMRAYSGCVITYGDASSGCYFPLGNIKQYNGAIIKIGNPTATASFRTVPPKPPTSSYSQSFNKTGLGTYQYAWSNWATDEWGNRAIQGIYSSYGNKAGHIFFDVSSIRNFISSGTILDGNTITLTRKNGGGSSGATNIYINASSVSSASGTPTYSNNTLLGTLKWNETKTFTLPKNIVSALKTGTANSLACYSGSDGAYAEIVNASITIKVNK